MCCIWGEVKCCFLCMAFLLDKYVGISVDGSECHRRHLWRLSSTSPKPASTRAGCSGPDPLALSWLIICPKANLHTFLLLFYIKGNSLSLLFQPILPKEPYPSITALHTCEPGGTTWGTMFPWSKWDHSPVIAHRLLIPPVCSPCCMD